MSGGKLILIMELVTLLQGEAGWFFACVPTQLLVCMLSTCISDYWGVGNKREPEWGIMVRGRLTFPCMVEFLASRSRLSMCMCSGSASMELLFVEVEYVWMDMFVSI